MDARPAPKLVGFFFSVGDALPGPVIEVVEVPQAVLAGMVGPAAAAAGLLIGERRDTRIVVTRAVRCPITAPVAGSAEQGTITRGALENVVRALHNDTAQVVGIYRSSRADVFDARDIEPLPAPALLVHVAIQEEPEELARAWWLSAADSKRIDLTILDAKEGSRLPQCPD